MAEAFIRDLPAVCVLRIVARLIIVVSALIFNENIALCVVFLSGVRFWDNLIFLIMLQLKK